MIRKEELEQRALSFLADEHVEPSDLTAMLLQVEREVFRKVVDKIEIEMEKENESTDDQIWEIRDWLKAQQQELA